MRPSEFYAETPHSITWDLYGLLNGRALGECSVSASDIPDGANTRVMVKEHYHRQYDSCRCASIYSVWFDDRPVMLYRRAGRDGRDQQDRVITDRGAFWDMIRYIGTLPQDDGEPNDDVRDADEDIVELDELYGSTVSAPDIKGPGYDGPWSVGMQTTGPEVLISVQKVLCSVDPENTQGEYIWGEVLPGDYPKLWVIPGVIEVHVHQRRSSK